MPYIKEHTQNLVLLQNEQRRNWREGNTPESLAQMIVEENEEKREHLELAELGEDPIEVASEYGDLFYLCIKYLKAEPNPSLEILGIMYQALEECSELGIDPEHVVLLKLHRNDVKYPGSMSNNEFSRDDERRFAKSMYRDMGGDALFFYAYMMNVEQMYPEFFQESKPSAIVPYTPPVNSIVVYQGGQPLSGAAG